MSRRLASTPTACYSRGLLAERMIRRAEMARVEAGEGHWGEMVQLVRNYETSARALKREGAVGGDVLDRAIALAITVDKYAQGRPRGAGDRKMAERAGQLKTLAEEAAGALRRGCRA